MSYYHTHYYRDIWERFRLGYEVAGIMLAIHRDFKPLYDGNFFWMTSKRAGKVYYTNGLFIVVKVSLMIVSVYMSI